MSISYKPPQNYVPPQLPCHTYSGYDQFSAFTDKMGEKREYAQSSVASGYVDRNEGYASYSSTGRSGGLVPTDFGHSHNQFQFKSPADVDGDTLKKKLDRPQSIGRTPTRSLLSASANELLSRSTPLYHGDRSANERSTIDRSSQTRLKTNNSNDSTSENSDHDSTGAEGTSMEDGESFKRLHVDDVYMLGGQKRRAGNLHCRGLLDITGRVSPQDPFTNHARSAKMPPISTSQSYSYITNISLLMHPPSITTASPGSRRLPVGTSPGVASPISCDWPDKASDSYNTSPGPFISGMRSIKCRTISSGSAHKITEVQKLGGLTVQKLNAHKGKKKHKCSFCDRTFKNKTEARRHENSVHECRYLWSCSAHSVYYGAFHDSTKQPGEADTCGYCGDEFPRSGRGPGTGALNGGNAPRHATEQDWDERIRHLQEVHKFQKCKLSQRFSRADHFSHHVKKVHAGTSGKWSKMLHNACMLQEVTTRR